ncbi:hypothetical protein K8942_03815 [Candidatus Peribacteria bacterium]|nr:MAG: hypothetical protein K8942_03815 [Candidatus Peribacteria bacterium]
MNTFLFQVFSFLFYPNPANADYSSPKSVALLVLCILLMAGAVALSVWRKKMSNAVTRKLSRTWPTASFWFGFVGLILVVSRVEQIQFVSMRVWWLVWAILAVLYITLQFRLFRARHYEVLPTKVTHDPRSKYLPRKRK